MIKHTVRSHTHNDPCGSGTSHFSTLKFLLFPNSANCLLMHFACLHLQTQTRWFPRELVALVDWFMETELSPSPCLHPAYIDRSFSEWKLIHFLCNKKRKTIKQSLPVFLAFNTVLVSIELYGVFVKKISQV